MLPVLLHHRLDKDLIRSLGHNTGRVQQSHDARGPAINEVDRVLVCCCSYLEGVVT